MKKFVKGCLILAAVCAVLGGVACVTGLVLGAGTRELQQAFRESGLKDWIWEIGSDSSEESFDWEKESDVSKTLDSFSSEEIDSLEIELKYGLNSRSYYEKLYKKYEQKTMSRRRSCSRI